MRSSRKKWPGAWIGIVLASSFLLVGAMKMSAYAEPAESTETAEITESSTGAGLSDMDFGMGDGQIELDPYDIKLAANDTNQGKHQFIDVVGTKVIVFFCISCFVGLINLFLGMLQN